jgi:hypothetical protein
MTPEIRAAVKTLAAAFQAILEVLAKEETPKPKPVPPEHKPRQTIYHDLRTGEMFTISPQGKRQPLHFIPRGYQAQDGGYWAPLDLGGPFERYARERLGPRW